MSFSAPKKRKAQTLLERHGTIMSNLSKKAKKEPTLPAIAGHGEDDCDCIILKLCMPFFDKRALECLALTCKDMYQCVREEKQHRTFKLAKVAYACIKENKGMMVMAGSMPLWLSLGGPLNWFPSNVDIWCWDTCAIMPSYDCKMRIKKVFKKESQCHNMETRCGVVKLIFSENCTRPWHILTTYDISCCRIASAKKNEYTTLKGFDSKSFYTFGWDKMMIDCKFDHLITKNVFVQDYLITKNDFEELVQNLSRRREKYEKRGFEYLGQKEATVPVGCMSWIYKYFQEPNDSSRFETKLQYTHFIGVIFNHLKHEQCVKINGMNFFKPA